MLQEQTPYSLWNENFHPLAPSGVTENTSLYHIGLLSLPYKLQTLLIQLAFFKYLLSAVLVNKLWYHILSLVRGFICASDWWLNNLAAVFPASIHNVFPILLHKCWHDWSIIIFQVYWIYNLSPSTCLLYIFIHCFSLSFCCQLSYSCVNYLFTGCNMLHKSYYPTTKYTWYSLYTTLTYSNFQFLYNSCPVAPVSSMVKNNKNWENILGCLL